MNELMFAFLGLPEILVIFLVLLVMAGMAAAAALLLVWLLHQQGKPDVVPPAGPSKLDHRSGSPGWLSFVEMRAGTMCVRWGAYFSGLTVVVVACALLNGLLWAAGVWSGMDTVLFGLLVGVIVFNVVVLRDFHKAGKSGPAQHAPSGDAPSANPPPDLRPPDAAVAGACPRCGVTLPANSPQGLCPRCVMGVGLAANTETSGEVGPHGTRVRQPAPAPADLAKHFPQLEILECLGRGGMGVVYKARQPKLNRFVALKILAPERGADPRFAERFQREARALAKLNHPNIVTVHDFGETEGMCFLLMEFVDGVSLRQTMHDGRMQPETALAIVPRICEALQFAHEQGIVHRDIKPENVLLDKQGHVKIADFGIAKIVGEAGGPADSSPPGSRADHQASLTQDQVLGTPHYMAPEQVEKPQLVDHRADIYSLGVVFYEMLTGELPLGKFQPPSKKVQVDVRLDEVVLRTLEKEPERRYQHASEVKTDVERISGTPPPNPDAGPMRATAGGATPPPRVLPPPSSNAVFTAESVRTQFVIMAVTWWIGMPLSAVGELLPPPGNLVVGISSLPLLILAVVFWCILLYRHWSLLQGHGARTTPGKAVGFGFIPLYCFYWWFVAYAGLATDNNRYLDQVGITTARMSRGLAIASSVLGILGCTVGLIPVVGAAVMLPYMIVGFIPTLQQRDCVLAILEHRAVLSASQPQHAG